MRASRAQGARIAVVVALTTAWLLALSSSVLAEVPPPHVAIEADTDSCAMCHRSHSSGSEVFARDALGTRIQALIVGTYAEDTGDTELCYTCHGVETLGSEKDVQGEFLAGSGHVLTPGISTFGPATKQCSDCHDTHGGGAEASSTMPAALLRAKTTTTTVHSGNEYCVVCHAGRPAEIFDGLGVFGQTRHADITPTVSGTNIVCSACHQPHGSANPPLIVSQLATPSAPATYAVPANDRWLCYGCHPGDQDTYHGGIAYEASGHGSSDATIAAEGEWVARREPGSAETSRAVGECQVCHRPMGVDDGTGTAIPKLAALEGKDLCYVCHGLASTVATDVASVDFPDADGVTEVITAFGATTSTVEAARLQVRSRLTTTSTTLGEPREFLQGRIGPIDTGDIDGDGVTELLVARSGLPSVAVLAHSPLAGLAPDPGDAALIETADYLVVANVLGDAGLELVTATGSTVRTYRWSVGSFQPVVGGSVTFPSGAISGLTAGNVLGTSLEELAVTLTGPDALYVVTGELGTLTENGPYATLASPRGPSIGDLSGDGVGEIAVANSGETTALASVFDGAGNALAVADDDKNATQRAQSTAIGQLFAGITPVGTSGAELVVVRDAPAGDDRSRVSAFPQEDNGGGFAVPIDRTIGNWANPTSVVIGDLEGRGRPQAIVAFAGSRSQEASAQAPGIASFRVRADLTEFDGTAYYYASGAESAGSGSGGAWIVAADLGPIGPSRHASGAVPDTHVSTETASFARHVECSDCHNTHESTDADDAAPNVYGSLLGAWGVSVSNAPVGSITFTEKQGVDREYELCMKCHSEWAPSTATRDIASEFDTRLTSFHAVEGVNTASEATAGSFVSATPAWDNDSMVYCIDCHGNGDAALARGPHYSPSAPLMLQPFVGVTSDTATQLCFRCHRDEVYLTGTADGPANPTSTSNFYDADVTAGRETLHSFHVLDREVGCEGCHASHGSDEEHLIRSDVGWTHAGSGGACATGCHTGGVSHSYTRP